MPFDATSADGIVYETDQMRLQGKSIADDAQQGASNTKTFWQGFQQTCQKMPLSVQRTLKAFEDTHQPSLDQLFTQRTTIGHLLSGAASQMEQEDANVRYAFYKNIPLPLLTK